MPSRKGTVSAELPVTVLLMGTSKLEGINTSADQSLAEFGDSASSTAPASVFKRMCFVSAANPRPVIESWLKRPPDGATVTLGGSVTLHVDEDDEAAMTAARAEAAGGKPTARAAIATDIAPQKAATERQLAPTREPLIVPPAATSTPTALVDTAA